MKLFVYLLAAVFCQDVTVITTVAEVTIVQPTTTQDAIGVLTTMVELATTQAAPGSATPVVGSGTGNGRGNGAGDRPSSAFGSKLPSPLVAFFIRRTISGLVDKKFELEYQLEAREAIPLFESPEQAIIPFKLEKLIDKQYEAIDGLSEIFKSIRSVRGKSYDRDLEEKIAKHLEGLNLDTEKNLMRIIIAEKAGVKAKIDTFNARQISLFGKDAKLIDTDAADFIASRETIRRFAIGNYLSSKIQRVKIGQDDIHSIYYNDLDFWLELLEGSTYKQLIGILTSHE